MIKTYISALLVVLFAGAQMGLAQESLDDVFAQLDEVGMGDGSAAQPAASAAPARTAPVFSETFETADGVSVEVMEPDAASVAAPTSVAAGRRAAMSEQDALFNKGITHYKAGEYDEAEAAFDSMLANDKYDSRAMVYLKRTAQRIAAKELRKQSGTRASAMADVNEAWNLEPKDMVAIETGSDDTVESPDVAAKAAMEARLKSIMIPSLDFRNANIEDVVAFLSETCRRLDPPGVNILLIGMNRVQDVGIAGDSSITISIRDMSLYDALSFITEMAELKFEVQPRVVAVMPINYVRLETLVLKSYDIIPEVGSNMESLSGGNSGGGVDDLFGDTSFSTSSDTGPIDVSKFFSIVDWPDGTSAVYQPRFHKLFVKNTPKNISSVEDILDDLEQEAIRKRSQQVRIETKFIEFNEGALQELGFDWTLYDDGEFAGFGLGSLDPNNSTYYRPAVGYTSGSANFGNGDVYNGAATGAGVIGVADGQNLFGLGQRNNTTAFSAMSSGIASTLGGVPGALVLSNNGKFPLDLTISAMEQDGTADVLSTPEVTTKSGNEAILRVVEVHRYPQDYDVETGQRTAPVVKPQDWEEEDLGVVLRVTPVVDPEANTIDLDLQPVIKKFKGFDDYLVAYNAYAASANNSDASVGAGAPLFARMPYFETRSVQTQVTVYDGHTIGMGGLKSETTETFSDRIPLLGDIPYLGRLFRTEGSRSSKRNLMIFVKATQVDDRGMTRADRAKMKGLAE